MKFNMSIENHYKIITNKRNSVRKTGNILPFTIAMVEE